MPLRKWGDRIRRGVAPHTSTAPEKRENTAAAARQDRAGTVAHLREDVHRIQHEIASLSQPQVDGEGETDQAAVDQRILALQKELEQTQQALARYQGRV